MDQNEAKIQRVNFVFAKTLYYTHFFNSIFTAVSVTKCHSIIMAIMVILTILDVMAFSKLPQIGLLSVFLQRTKKNVDKF